MFPDEEDDEDDAQVLGLGYCWFNTRGHWLSYLPFVSLLYIVCLLLAFLPCVKKRSEALTLGSSGPSFLP